jgi:hypothetical protein
MRTPMRHINGSRLHAHVDRRTLARSSVSIPSGTSYNRQTRSIRFAHSCYDLLPFSPER